ncbi:Lar family restriction alleviation protein [Pseudomonas urmiensis]|uniref:Lar family restriction alleviation protein n=1 Tax=Pseudomonas urmiensis TaxID=2745493 RepID=UPI003D12236D
MRELNDINTSKQHRGANPRGIPMPTENRSSNTQKTTELSPCPFCGQQDAFVEQLDSDASVVICQGRIDEYSACLARGPVGVQQHEGEDQPGRDQGVKEWNKRAAAQNHPEPIAWMVGAAIWWTKEEAERDSAATGLPIVGLGPMADTGSIDQLSQIIRDLNDERDEMGAEAGRLRTQVALLRQSKGLLKISAERLPRKHQTIRAHINHFLDDIDASLSTSAEPSTPKCKHPIKCARFDNGEIVDHVCQDCLQVFKPSAPVERDERAAFERDERAMTKAFHDWAFYKKGEAIGRMDGQQAGLEGFIAGADWQARAALERKPS